MILEVVKPGENEISFMQFYKLMTGMDADAEEDKG